MQKDKEDKMPDEKKLLTQKDLYKNCRRHRCRGAIVRV